MTFPKMTAAELQRYCVEIADFFPSLNPIDPGYYSFHGGNDPHIFETRSELRQFLDCLHDFNCFFFMLLYS
jgi:hypothetical protein